MSATKSEFIAAIDTALQCNKNLANLLPQPHLDEALRNFLREIKARLEST